MKQLAFLIIWLLPLVTKAQEIPTLGEPLTIIKFPSVDLVSFDTKDQLYISSGSGDIGLFNSSGKQMNLFSPARQGRLNQLEAAWTVNIFSFSADLQAYRILDRFLNPLVEKGFMGTEVNLARAATLGNNNVIWVWDESDMSLKKIDYLRNLVIQSQPLNLILNSEDLSVTEIREFKNKLFVNVPASGIYIFDNQGNLIRKVNVKSVRRMAYFQEHLIYLEGANLMAIAVANDQPFAIATLKNPPPSYLQVGQEKLALVYPDKLEVYPLPGSMKKLK